MVLDHNLVKDDYVLAYDWQPTKVSWHLVEGTLLKAMDGSYELQPKGAGTTVTYRPQRRREPADDRALQAQGREDDHRRRAEEPEETGRGLTAGPGAEPAA